MVEHLENFGTSMKYPEGFELKALYKPTFLGDLFWMLGMAAVTTLIAVGIYKRYKKETTKVESEELSPRYPMLQNLHRFPLLHPRRAA